MMALTILERLSLSLAPRIKRGAIGKRKSPFVVISVKAMF